jgi:hypothetical protein
MISDMLISKAITDSVRFFLDSCPEDFVFPMGGDVAIPMQSEESLIACLEKISEIPNISVASLRCNLTVRETYRMLVFAVRMAVHAVRINAPHYLRTGLFGLFIDDKMVDWRDFLCALTIIDDCARRLALSLDDEPNLFSDWITVPNREIIDGYLSRSPEMRRVEVMGYVAQNRSDGLCYVWKG